MVTKCHEGKAKGESGVTASDDFEVSAPRTAQWGDEKGDGGCRIRVLPRFPPLDVGAGLFPNA